ncbi:MAG: TIGR02588 family protein [Cyanobacteria bacterium P01_E01_bin.6]
MTEPRTYSEQSSHEDPFTGSGESGSGKTALNDRTMQQERRSLAEWITFVLASIILIALIALILYDWQINQLRPPEFHIMVDNTTRIANQRYYVPFEIQNTGGRIARTVQVMAALHIDGEEDESGEQQIDFLSGNERKRGSFVFTHNPRQGELIIRVASYRLP